MHAKFAARLLESCGSLPGSCQGVCCRWLLTSPNPTSSLYENLIPRYGPKPDYLKVKYQYTI